MELSPKRRTELESLLTRVRHRRVLFDQRLKADPTFYAEPIERVQAMADHWRSEQLVDRVIARLGHDPLHIECPEDCPGRIRSFVAVVPDVHPEAFPAPDGWLFAETEVEQFVENIKEFGEDEG